MTGESEPASEVASATRRRPTYGTRLDDYRQFATRSAWVAGGVVGLIALAAGDLGAHLFEHGPRCLSAGVVTLTLAAGGCAAFARVEFQWAATKLQRRIEAPQDLSVDKDAPIDEPWEKRPEYLLRAALILTAAAGLAFVVLLWATAY